MYIWSASSVRAYINYVLRVRDARDFEFEFIVNCEFDGINEKKKKKNKPLR